MNSNIRLFAANIDITQYISSITWSGDKQNVARSLSVSHCKRIFANVGDNIIFYAYGQELFFGMVVDADENGFSAMDYAIYLARNMTYKEYNDLPSHIAMQVCSEFNVPVHCTFYRDYITKIVSTGNLSGYQVIYKAFEGEEEKEMDICCYRYQQRGFHILYNGSDFAGYIENGLISSHKSESIKNMVNRVVILNSDNMFVGSVDNVADINRYGLFSKTYKHSKDLVYANTDAAKELVGVSKKYNITAMGNHNFITGSSGYLNNVKALFKGMFFILSDSHTFSAKVHSMDLEVHYFEQSV